MCVYAWVCICVIIKNFNVSSTTKNDCPNTKEKKIYYSFLFTIIVSIIILAIINKISVHFFNAHLSLKKVITKFKKKKRKKNFVPLLHTWEINFITQY